MNTFGGLSPRSGTRWLAQQRATSFLTHATPLNSVSKPAILAYTLSAIKQIKRK